jgi:hypothetical protein
VKITTGKEKNMGTVSNVYVKIWGTKKRHTGKQFLEIGSKGFAPGSIETFSLDCIDVGEVKQVEVCVQFYLQFCLSYLKYIILIKSNDAMKVFCI